MSLEGSFTIKFKCAYNSEIPSNETEKKKNNKNAFDRRLTNRGSQSWSQNKSWSEPVSINLDLHPMTLTYELDFDILKI